MLELELVMFGDTWENANSSLNVLFVRTEKCVQFFPPIYSLQLQESYSNQCDFFLKFLCVCVCVSAHRCENVFHIIYLFASFRSAQIDRWLRCVFYRGTGKWKKSHFTQTGVGRCCWCYCQYKSFCCISDNVNSDWFQHLYPRSTIPFTFALDQVSVYLCGCITWLHVFV